MNMSPDKVTRKLVEKKRELLERLLSYSQLFAMREQESGRWSEKKKEMLSFLEQTDQSLKIREEQTGISARDQETALFSDIKYLLESIYSNNQRILNELNQEKENLDVEKTQLEKGTKLSGYIYQQKSNVTFKPMLSKKRPDPSTVYAANSSGNYGRIKMYQKTLIQKDAKR